MDDLTDSARHLQGLDDRELQRVLALSRADYTPEAIAVAEAELKRRSLPALNAEQYWRRFPEERITGTAVTTPLDFAWGKLIFGAVLFWVAYHLHGVFSELEIGARASARMHWILAELYRNLGHRITVGIVALGGGLALVLALRQVAMQSGRKGAAHVSAIGKVPVSVAPAAKFGHSAIPAPVDAQLTPFEFAAGCLMIAGISAAALLWVAFSFFYAPSQPDVGGQPSSPHPRPGATPVSPEAAVRLALATHLNTTWPRLELMKGNNLDIYMDRSSFDAIPFPDRPKVVSEVGKAWCDGVLLLYMPGVRLRDITSGRVLASYSCVLRRGSVKEE